jgi:arylsulfatase A-like enzyme
LALSWQLTSCQPEQLSPTTTHHPEAATRVSAADASGHPNIVVIMTDDEAVTDMHVMPNTNDLIGSKGVIFDNNIVTFSLCCPSRATFLTGQYSHNHGVRDNAPPNGGFAAFDNTNALPVWLQTAGYRTAHIGKYLNGYGETNALQTLPGYTEWYFATGGTDYMYFNYSLNENGSLVTYGSTDEEYKTDVYTRKAVDVIHRWAPDAGVTPFYLFITYLAPHIGTPVEPGDPNLGTPVPAPRHKGVLASEVLPAFPSFNEADVSDKPKIIRALPLLTTDIISQVTEANRQRLESLLSVDEGVKTIIDELETDGVLDNTLIIFTSDNGWLQGQHRIRQGKDSPYKASVQVPLMIRGPGITGGRHNSAAVANIDLAPTIVAATGATALRTMDGRSLFPFLTGGQTAWLSGNGPRHLLVETNPGAGAGRRWASVRQGDLVYTEYANGNREYYNLHTDPDELTSRHNDPATAKNRLKLHNSLTKLVTCVGPTACW